MAARSQSMPGLGTSGMKATLHHRGENTTGFVQGFDHVGEDLYVPRAQWTESADSPMKHHLDPHQFIAEGQKVAQHRQGMTHLLRRGLNRQVDDKKGLKATEERNEKDWGRRTVAASMTRMSQEEKYEKEEKHIHDKAFREGLDEQAAHNARRAMENRLREAHEGAEIKLRTTQQLCEELAQQSRQRDARKRELAEGMNDVESKTLQKRSEKKMDNEELRRTMRASFNNEQDRDDTRLARVKGAMAGQEMVYKHYSDTTALEERARHDKEIRRLDRDEKHHQLRTDIMYGQREMARERQRQRMKQTLDDQMEAKLRASGTVGIRQDYELRSVNEATRMSMEADLHRMVAKRADELENQAALVAQMAENQQRRKADNGPHHRQSSAESIMNVTPGMLASADSWRMGATSLQNSASAIDMAQRMDAAKHLSKPMGKPEVEVDIAKSFGPGGLVGVWGGDGPTRSQLMMSGGPTRLLTKASSIAAHDRRMAKHWHEGISAEELKAGRKAARGRREATMMDKALT